MCVRACVCVCVRERVRIIYECARVCVCVCKRESYNHIYNHRHACTHGPALSYSVLDAMVILCSLTPASQVE